MAICCLFFFFLPGNSRAAQIWIAADKYEVETGKSVNLSLGQGVSFPESYELIFKKGLSFTHYRPDGTEEPLPLEPGSKVTYKAQVSLKTPGAHIFSASIKDFRLIKTGRGWMVAGRSTKALGRSLTMNKFTKTLVSAGKGVSRFNKAIGQSLEIVPLRDPGLLHPGDRLTVQVLFKGKPAEMQLLKATYAGYNRGGELVAAEKITDIRGKTTLVLTRPGTWFLYVFKVEKEKGRPRRRRGKKNIYESSLVFHLKGK
ncbi:MAG: DUF4198 domain-containing protein [bacterium]